MGKKLDFGEHLTPASYDNSFRRTFLGMAHIAGTGPHGKECGECAFFVLSKKDEGSCSYRIPNKAKRNFPKQAASCRFFMGEDKKD